MCLTPGEKEGEEEKREKGEEEEDKLGDRRKMITTVKCLLHDLFSREMPAYASVQMPASTIFQVVAFCHEDSVPDYKFDTGAAICLITQMTQTAADAAQWELMAEDVGSVMRDDINSTANSLLIEAQMGNKMPLQSTPQRTSPNPEWPTGKRCRALSSYPSNSQ